MMVVLRGESGCGCGIWEGGFWAMGGWDVM